MKGGMCSDTQPKPGYQIIDKCVGNSQGVGTYCGYCWKYMEDEVPCDELCKVITLQTLETDCGIQHWLKIPILECRICEF